MAASSFLYLLISILTSKVSSQATNPPTTNPTANPTTATTNPTSQPTITPTVTSTAPSAAPTAAPTFIPTIKETFCNLFDGREMSNIISTQQSAVISNIYIEDPLLISFDFIIGENECTTVQDKICNLIQFGATTEDIFFPRISTKNHNGTLYWNIEMSMGDSTPQSISYNLNQAGVNNDSFAITANTKSNFHITFNGFQRQFYIGAKRFHYSDDNSNDFEALTNDSQPFYVSNPDQASLNANITNLCISTKSAAPTIDPTHEPSTLPTFLPTAAPTETIIKTTAYKKIDCYTEYGKEGEQSLSCSKSDYMVISCGIYRLNNSIDTSDVLFFKGSYIERLRVNDLTSDGICYIDYNTNNADLRSSIQPQARCCNFKQQYNDDFRCRYFKSEDETLGTSQSATQSSASKANEFTYTTCPKEFPLLLSCTTRVDEDDKVTNVAESNDDIQFYGSFYAKSGDTQFNPDYNLYFELNTGSTSSSQFVPFAPTTSTTSTSQIPTKAPTDPPTSSADILQLNISQSTRCVSQYGNTVSNYTITAIATCCTESYSTSAPNETIVQTTAKPTPAPTVKTILQTAFFGSNGTNTGERFKDREENYDSVIIGIDEWAIFQVEDQTPSSINNTMIIYQGILIGTYKISDGSTTRSIEQDSDFYKTVKSSFNKLDSKPCSSFMLDIVNGSRDFITGFDVHYTYIAIFGLTFYTSFGRKYSCPDDEDFTDTSVPTPSPVTVDDKGGGSSVNYLDDKYYTMLVVRQRDVFGSNGSYKLSGWQGWYQTRTLEPAVVRSVMGSIGFYFTGEPFTTTNNPTSTPTSAPTKLVPTLSPTFVGQEASEELKCSTMWGVNRVSCKAESVTIMTGCNGYSVEGQILNTFIEDSTDGSECIVETINNKTAAAIGTCCYFYNTPPRNFDAFIYTSVVGSCIFGSIFIFMWLYLCLVERHKTYFNPAEIDDDTKIDEAIENVGEAVASYKVAQFRVDDDEHMEMLEIQKILSVDENLVEPVLIE